MKGESCVRAMVYKARNYVTPAPNTGALLRMHTGQHVGLLARDYFPGGILVESEGLDAVAAAAATAETIARNPAAVFEATFAVDNLSARIDILQRTADGWRAIEVKSSKSAKPDAKKDLAFQVYVARLTGLHITESAIMHLNGEYRHPDGASEYDVKQLLTVTDVTKEVEKLQAPLPKSVEVLQGHLADRGLPDVPMLKRCFDCDYFAHCESRLLPLDVAYLYKPGGKQIDELRAADKRTLYDLIESDCRNEVQVRQITAEQTHKDVLDKDAVLSALAMPYPIHFIDFETVNPGLPIWPGTAPYEVIPFQWSNHVMLENGEVFHYEFLAKGDEDPRAEFIKTLSASCEGAATIVVYSSFEENRVANLAQLQFPQAETFVADFESRRRDLLEVLRQHTYFRGFNGSYSIKVTLPTLVNFLSYKNLEIQDGNAASAAFLRMLTEEPPEREKTRRALLEYCKRDTYAMVRIFQELKELCESD